MTYHRKNAKNSWFELYLKDEEDTEAGLYLYTQKDEKKTAERKQLCTVIYLHKRIESFNTITGSKKIIYELVVVDKGEEQKFLVQAKNLFDSSYSDNDDWKEIQNSGFKIWDTNKRLILEFLKLQDEVCDVIKGIENIGWYNNDYFVGGFTTSDEIVFTGSDANGFKKGGTKEEQYSLIKGTLTDFPLVFFVYAYSAGGFFNRFIGEDHNQILEVMGESSSGKSTSGKFTMSIKTSPSEYASFNMTKNSIAETLKYYNDSFIYFDETGEMKVKDDERTELIYTLANAKTKARVRRKNRDGDFHTETQVRLFYSLLIGGEVSILNNIKKTGGIEARLCQIVLDKTTHLFENVTSEFIEDFNLQVSKNYGWLAPELIHSIKDTSATIQEQYAKNLEFVRDRYQINSVIENRKIKVLAYVLLSAAYICNIIFTKEEQDKATTLIENMLDKAYEAIFKNVSYTSETDDPFKISMSAVYLTHTKNFVVYDVLENEVNNPDHIKDFYGYIHKKAEFLEVKVISQKIEDFCNSLKLDKDRLLSYFQEQGFLVTDKEAGRRTKKVKGVNYYYFKIPYDFFETKNKGNIDISEPITLKENDAFDEEVTAFDDETLYKPVIDLK